jgi:CBS domain-containing protein
MMTTVRQMLAGKTDVYAVAPEDTVFSALSVMAEKNCGAVLVMRNGAVQGILSERDYARKMVLQGRTSHETRVSDVMTARVITVGPDWSAAQCMALMTERHIRHLPVTEDEELIGVISIGDVVRAVVEEQQFTISSLESYIMSGG